jgi:hypothetical protein
VKRKFFFTFLRNKPNQIKMILLQKNFTKKSKVSFTVLHPHNFDFIFLNQSSVTFFELSKYLKLFYKQFTQINFDYYHLDDF